MRNFRAGNQHRAVENEAYQSLVSGVGSFFGAQSETQWVLGAIAREVANLDDLSRIPIRALDPLARDIGLDLSFLRSSGDRRRFLAALRQIRTSGRSIASLTAAINQAVGYTFVTSIWQANPDVSGVDLTVSSVAGPIATGHASNIVFAFPVYGAWQPVGRIIISSNSPDANCGTFQVTAISPTLVSWRNPSAFSPFPLGAGPYSYVLSQAVSQNCPLKSGLNGVEATEPQNYSVNGGTQYSYAAGDAFWSGIQKLRIQTANSRSYERKIAEMLLCSALPAWVDFDFASAQFFTLASSKMDSETRMA